MAFNPLKEKGTPMDKQIHTWSQMNVKPYDKEKVHPYTRCRGILMNGIEVEGAIFKHQFARHTSDPDLKREIGFIRRTEQQQQKMVNWMIPADESILEVTLGYEQVAVDLTAFLARTVTDPYVKQIFDFGLLEDFDHLYRYSNLLELTDGVKPEKIVGKYTEIMPGRPTIAEHRHPYDEIRKPVDRTKGDPKTTLYILTLLAGEQQTMNFYMNVGNRIADHIGRGLYLEIGQIEEQHVSQYESLLDPRASWFEMNVWEEYNECYLYHSFMEQETDAKAKKTWEMHLNMEIEHLRIASEMMKKYEKVDPAEFLPANLPEPIIFESNIDYVRDVLANQVDFTALETEIIPMSELEKDARYHKFQKTINAGGVPSEKVIEEIIDRDGKDYRWELKGPHPVEKLRQKEAARR
jgi:rubrerythrin